MATVGSGTTATGGRVIDELEQPESEREIEAPSTQPVPSRRVIVIDIYGNLTLHVGEELEWSESFLVQSTVLAQASRVFWAMLYGCFAEGQRRHPNNNWCIDLPRDHPRAFEVLLRIMHANYHKDLFKNGAQPTRQMAAELCKLAGQFLSVFHKVSRNEKITNL